MNELVLHKIVSQKKDGAYVYFINNDLVRILEG